MRLRFPVWASRVLLPLVGVSASVFLLALAALALAFDALSPTSRRALFAAGALCWMAGIGWGTWINGRPLPRHA